MAGRYVDPLGREPNVSGFGRGAPSNVSPLPLRSREQTSYQNALEHLADAINPRTDREQATRGESARFFNMLMDRGAMNDFAPARDRSIESTLEERNRPWPSVRSDAWASFQPFQGSPQVNVRLGSQDTGSDVAMTALRVLGNRYNLPAVDKNLERFILQGGMEDPSTLNKIVVNTANSPEPIRAENLNFVRDDDVRLPLLASVFPDRTIQQLYHSGGEFKPQVSWNTRTVDGLPAARLMAVVDHESGHLLDSFSNWRDPEKPFSRYVDEGYFDAVSADIGSMPAEYASGDFQTATGFRQVDPYSEFATDYSRGTNNYEQYGESVEEDYSERFSQFLADRYIAPVFTFNGEPLAFSDVFPNIAKYFQGRLDLMSREPRSSWRYLE